MNLAVIDVREPNEFTGGHLEGAINMPMSELAANKDQFLQLSKSKNLVLYCRSGARAETAKLQLHSWGILNVVNGINQTSIEKMLNTA